jgi:NAD/NADP transhydrogenase alpha subunit
VKLEATAGFESIESAQEYFELLAEVVLESQQVVQTDIQVKVDSGSARHVEALRLIGFKLERLASHIKMSRRILNDLRMLRRIVYQRDGDGGLND